MIVLATPCRIVLAVVVAMLLAACTEPPPPDLDRAAHVIRSMMTPRHLAKSAFSSQFENPGPSQFVSYLFSDLGAAEWPIAGVDDPEQLAAIGVPLPPRDVAYFPRLPNPESGRQIVVSSDDTRGVVIVRGYTSPDQSPVLEYEWRLPSAIDSED